MKLEFGVVPVEKAGGLKQNQAIFSPVYARRLIALGHRVIDIKPNRNAKERTVFYFEITPKFVDDFHALQAARKNEV